VCYLVGGVKALAVEAGAYPWHPKTGIGAPHMEANTRDIETRALVKRLQVRFQQVPAAETP